MSSRSAPLAENHPTDARERLRTHFNEPVDTHPQLWDALWEAGDFLPWDKGFPNPALEDVLAERHDLLGRPVLIDGNGEFRRKRALVPGCGKGYDVLLLASFGYDAYGLEASENAVKACVKYAEAAEKEGTYPARSEGVGKGEAKFLHGDFFMDTWVGSTEEGMFDLIYDYTFLSALPPALRPAWAARMKQLLAKTPTSRLVCVEFPTYKPPSTGGPPWGLPSVVYFEHLTRPGEGIPYDEAGHVVPSEEKNPKTRGLVRVAHWQPKRTHEIGKGTDWVSIWKHLE